MLHCLALTIYLFISDFILVLDSRTDHIKVIDNIDENNIMFRFSFNNSKITSLNLGIFLVGYMKKI